MCLHNTPLVNLVRIVVFHWNSCLILFTFFYYPKGFSKRHRILEVQFCVFRLQARHALGICGCGKPRKYVCTYNCISTLWMPNHSTLPSWHLHSCYSNITEEVRKYYTAKTIRISDPSGKALNSFFIVSLLLQRAILICSV